MSTKIYIGQRATDFNAFTVADRIRAVLEPLFYARFDAALEKVAQNVGAPWTSVFQVLTQAGSPWVEPIGDNSFRWKQQVYKLMVELKNTSQHTFSELDFGYDAILVPNATGPGALPLVLVFSERAGDEYRQALIDAGVVTEYGYWDNTDGPEGMSAADWAAREKAWGALNVPSEDGLKIQMPSQVQTVYRNVTG